MRKLNLPDVALSEMTPDEVSAALGSTLAIASVGIATLKMLETLLPAAADEVRRESRSISEHFVTLLGYVQKQETPPEEITSAIVGIIKGMQFEDRNTQIMDNVASILERYRSMLEEVSTDIEAMQTGATLPGHNLAGAVESILSGIRLGEIRTRYLDALAKANVAHAQNGNTTLEENDETADIIELF